MVQNSGFFKGFVLFLTLAAAVTVMLCRYQPFKPFVTMCWMANIIFALHAAILYLILRKSSLSPDRQRFLSVTMVNMLIKIVVSITFLIIYKLQMKPTNGKFIIPFIIIYLLYTIFETYFMLRLAELKPKKSNHEP